jgi:hypothetical protein
MERNSDMTTNKEIFDALMDLLDRIEAIEDRLAQGSLMFPELQYKPVEKHVPAPPPAPARPVVESRQRPAPLPIPDDVMNRLGQRYRTRR